MSSWNGGRPNPSRRRMPGLWRSGELAEALGLTVGDVSRLARRGIIPSLQLQRGGARFYRWADVRAALKRVGPRQV